ncbi:MAG: tyrosine-type recombinase/integrase [Gemmatimonadetes bacterium]|nr:tyrosine-type recombinase/integrase [Gemmatimonadota bacterium]
MSQWGRIPRNQMQWRGERAGWKDPLLDDDTRNLLRVHWYPSAIGAYFWRLYTHYLRFVRPSRLDHPYLFVNLDASRADTFGAPYRIESYTDQLARAVKRIGLRSLQANGTTSHGLRHAFAQSLRASGVSEKTIQIAMHHKSPLSQEVYTRPTRQIVAHALDQAEARAREFNANARAIRHTGATGTGHDAGSRTDQGDKVPRGLLETLGPEFTTLLP